MESGDLTARDRLRGHTLHVVAGAPDGIYVARMSAPGLEIHVAFLPTCIVIQGEAPFRGNGLVSVPGYGFRWFVGELSADYLASKFLRKGWHPEIARSALEDLAKGSERVAAWVAEYGTEFSSRCDFIDVWDWSLSESAPGYGYHPGDLGWLVAIQERFTELHREQT